MFLNAFVFSTLVPAAVLFSAVLSVGATKQNRDKEYEPRTGHRICTPKLVLLPSPKYDTAVSAGTGRSHQKNDLRSTDEKYNNNGKDQKLIAELSDANCIIANKNVTQPFEVVISSTYVFLDKNNRDQTISNQTTKKLVFSPIAVYSNGENNSTDSTIFNHQGKEENMITFFSWHGEARDGSTFNFYISKQGIFFASMLDFHDRSVTHFKHHLKGSNNQIVAHKSFFTNDLRDVSQTPMPINSSFHTSGTTMHMSLKGAKRKTITADIPLTIDLMIIWTPLAECAASGLDINCEVTDATKAVMDSFIGLIMSEINTAFTQSGVTNLSFDLVYSYRDEIFDGPFASGLEYIRNDNNNAVKNRNRFGADIVIFMNEGSYVSSSMQLVYSSKPYPRAAFFVMNRKFASGGNWLLEQLGSLMGCKTDRAASATCESDLDNYNYGYRDPHAKWRTIMAKDCQYSSVCPGSTSSYYRCPAILRFSSPNLLHEGTPIGTETSNNVRHLNDVKSIVANFRTRPNSCSQDSDCDDNNEFTLDKCLFDESWIGHPSGYCHSSNFNYARELTTYDGSSNIRFYRDEAFGALFDISSSKDLMIHTLGIYLVRNDVQVQIWTKPGSHGKSNVFLFDGWIQVYSGTASENMMLREHLEISTGETRAFYILFDISGAFAFNYYSSIQTSNNDINILQLIPTTSDGSILTSSSFGLYGTVKYFEQDLGRTPSAAPSVSTSPSMAPTNAPTKYCTTETCGSLITATGSTSYYPVEEIFGMKFNIIPKKDLEVFEIGVFVNDPQVKLQIWAKAGSYSEESLDWVILYDGHARSRMKLADPYKMTAGITHGFYFKFNKGGSFKYNWTSSSASNDEITVNTMKLTFENGQISSSIWNSNQFRGIIRYELPASPSESPSSLPTFPPTFGPSSSPSASAMPSSPPSQSLSPTDTTKPTFSPSMSPSLSSSPTSKPTMLPSTSKIPTRSPSEKPSMIPSVAPTPTPSKHPSVNPSTNPSVSLAPSTEIPSERPSEGQQYHWNVAVRLLCLLCILLLAGGATNL